MIYTCGCPGERRTNTDTIRSQGRLWCVNCGEPVKQTVKPTVQHERTPKK